METLTLGDGLSERLYQEGRNEFVDVLTRWRRTWLYNLLKQGEKVRGLDSTFSDTALMRLFPPLGEDLHGWVEAAIYGLVTRGRYVGEYRDFGVLYQKEISRIFTPLIPFISIEPGDRPDKEFVLARYEMEFLESCPQAITQKEIARWMKLIKFFIGPVKFKPKLFLPYSLYGRTHLIPFRSDQSFDEAVAEEKRHKGMPAVEGFFLKNEAISLDGLSIGFQEISGWFDYTRKMAAKYVRTLITSGKLPGEKNPHPEGRVGDLWQLKCITEPLHTKDPVGVVVVADLSQWSKCALCRDMSIAEKLNLFELVFVYDDRDRLQVIQKITEEGGLLLGVYQLLGKTQYEALLM